MGSTTMALLDIPTPPKPVFDVVKCAFLDEESSPPTPRERLHSSQGLSQLRMQSALDATIDTAPT